MSRSWAELMGWGKAIFLLFLLFLAQPMNAGEGTYWGVDAHAAIGEYWNPPPSVAVRWQMDFEGSGCTDSNSGDTCITANGTNADYSVVVLEGTKSAIMLGGNDEMEVASWTRDTGGITVDFIFNIVQDSGSATTTPYIRIMQLYDGTPLYDKCRLNFRPSTNQLSIGPFPSSGQAISNNTKYYGRMIYREVGTIISVANECSFDISATEFGDSDVWNSPMTWIFSFNGKYHTDLHWTMAARPGEDPSTQPNDQDRIVWDDIIICEGAQTCSGRCDTC